MRFDFISTNMVIVFFVGISISLFIGSIIRYKKDNIFSVIGYILFGCSGVLLVINIIITEYYDNFEKLARMIWDLGNILIMIALVFTGITAYIKTRYDSYLRKVFILLTLLLIILLVSIYK